jgi:hypothetical protein
MKTSNFILITVLIVMAICTSTTQANLERRGISSCYRKARLTQYWIPKEGEKDMTNNGDIITLTGSRYKRLKDRNGKTIAKVAKNTYDKFRMEGTGLLRSGVMVNLDGHADEFLKVNRKKTPYGLGSNRNGLTPWVSVATNDIKKGTTLYIKQLNGLKLPNGKRHNGCVRVDDSGWSMGSCQIDFFVLQYNAYRVLTKKIPSTVQVVQKRCKIQNYVTSSVKKWAVL